jgi:hypothetical protein
LTITPSTISAGTVQAIEFDLTFSPSSGDSPASLSLALPPGLVPNLGLDDGACLNVTSEAIGCEIGAGTAKAGFSTANLYLVKPPSASDFAGVALVSGLGTVEATGGISLRTTPDVGLDLSFPSLPANLTALDFLMGTVSTPTSCPSTPATIGVVATSVEDPTPATSTTPVPVSGCGSLPYGPLVAGAIEQNNGGAGATFTATITTSALASATQAFEVDLPASIQPNVTTALGCLRGTPCTIGTASAFSPVLPSSVLIEGTVQLGGSVVLPTLSVTFPPPFPLTFAGTIDLSTGVLTFNAIPDLPLTSLGVQIGGASPTQLLTTTCAPSSLTAKLTPWDGAAQQTTSTPITYTGVCAAPPTKPTTSPGRPAVSGASLRGVVKRAAKLAFSVKEGKGAKPIKRIAVSLPQALTFASRAGTLAKGISVRGAHARTVKFKARVSHGVLTITLSSAAASADVTLESPAIAVGSKLAQSVKKGLEKRKAPTLRFKFGLTGSGGAATTILLGLKPKS